MCFDCVLGFCKGSSSATSRLHSPYMSDNREFTILKLKREGGIVCSFQICMFAIDIQSSKLPVSLINSDNHCSNVLYFYEVSSLSLIVVMQGMQICLKNICFAEIYGTGFQSLSPILEILPAQSKWRRGEVLYQARLV